MAEFHFLQPIDVLYLRGNRLFGDSSATGEALMPPWPSMVAGALRSEMLVNGGIDTGLFVNGIKLSSELEKSLGSITEPGNFRISHLMLAKVNEGKLENVYLSLPADLVVISDGKVKHCHYLQPQALPASILTSSACEQLPLFKTEKPAKAEGGLWLNQIGIKQWLNAQPITNEHWVESKELWKIDSRLGIALDEQGRTTLDGQLYTVDAVAMQNHIGFLTGVEGANGLISDGVLRLGGDGRGAHHIKIAWNPLEPDWNLIEKTKRFRVILATPGLFEQGWLLPGMTQENGEYIWKTTDFSAHLVTASAARAETISGWDLAENSPKPALKAVSTGSVYWFDRFEGDIQSLRKLVESGLTLIVEYPDKKRCAEGFNNIFIAVWPL